MEKLYCTIFIVDVAQNPEEVENVTSRVQQLIEDHGGEIKRHNPWGKRRLAYPIRKRTSGYYVEIEYTANSRLNIPQILENEFRLNDRVLRYLTYVVTKEELIQREIDAKRMKSGATRYGDRPDNAGSRGPRPAPARREAPVKARSAAAETATASESTPVEKAPRVAVAGEAKETAPAETAAKAPEAGEAKETAPAETAAKAPEAGEVKETAPAETAPKAPEAEEPEKKDAE